MEPRRITPETPVGTEFTGRRKHVTFPRLWAYSGGPFAQHGWPKSNLHTDPAVARRVGLETVVASGGQFQAYVVELLVELLGDGWLGGGGRMDVRFVRSVPEGATVTARVTVRAHEGAGDGHALLLDVACVDGDGEVVLAGQASTRRP